MSLRTITLSLLLVLAGCEATAVLEPVPAFETCAFDSSIFERNPAERTVSFELGQVVDGGFVPFVDGDEIEMAPVPQDTTRLWYGMAAARVTPMEDLGETVCARLDQAILMSRQEEKPSGVLLRRVGDGTWVSAPVPFFLGTRRATESGFSVEDRTPVKFGPEAGFVPGGGGILRLWQDAVTLKPVNHVGFLSSPAVLPDAGPAPVVNFAVQLQAMPLGLRPGEAANVELRLEGERLGQQVDLTIGALPAGVELALQRTAIPAGATAAEALLTSGRLLVQPGANPGPFTLEVSARVASYTSSGSVELQVLPALTQRTVSVTVSPLALTLAPGMEGDVLVRLVPFGGFTGQVFLKAVGPTDLDITLNPESVVLAAPADVTVRVKLLRAGVPTTSLQLFAVSGREKWDFPQGLSVTTALPLSPRVYVVSQVREWNLITPGAPLDWPLDFGTEVALGQTPPTTSLLPPTAPPGCRAQAMSRSLRFSCDGGFIGAADVAVSAMSTAGTSSTSVRLVSSAGATLLPEVTPVAWDSTRPEAAFAPDGTLTVSQNSGLGLRTATINLDGGVSAYQQLFGQLVSLVPTPQGVLRLVQMNRNLSLTGKQAVRSDSIGPVASAVDGDGTVWVASGALQPDTTIRPAVSSSAPGAMTWAARDVGLSSAAAPTDLALSVRAGAAVLASVENDAVVVRAFAAGQWAALPVVPANAVPPAAFEGRGPERVLAIVHDALARPVLAFVGVDEQLHVLRLEGGAWASMGGASVAGGLLPLSISMSVDASGRAVLAWHEATHRLVGSSGQRVRPRHVAASALRLARLEGASFVTLPPLGLDRVQGVVEHPFVTVDAQGRPVIVFVEGGRVVVQRGPP